MINEKEVQRIAKLARLSLNEKELKKVKKDLSSILDYFDSLKEVNVSKVQPTFHPAESFFDKKLKIMREDKIKPELPKIVNKLVETAPERKGRCVKVKTVLK